MAIDLSRDKYPTNESRAKLEERRAELMCLGLIKRKTRPVIQPRGTSEYWAQYGPVSDQIRNAVRSVRTPTEVNEGQGAGGYYLVEWRVNPAGPPEDREIGGCGCACGCACGG